MKSASIISAYDLMAVGMTHRIAVGVAPQIKGASMREKQDFLEANLDQFRRRIVCGASDGTELVGVLITEAVHPDADVGVIYFVRQGYWAMCGSGTFALGVFLVESGLIEPVEPITEITLELVTGLMKVGVEVEDGCVNRVTTITEPVFHLRSAEIQLSDHGSAPIDIAYCLNYFEPMLDARALGIDVTLENRAELVRIGVEVRRFVNKTYDLKHPTNPAIDRAVQVQLYDPKPTMIGVDCVCAAVYGDDGFDLTPSGTSTCGHMATMHSKGALSVGDHFRMGSVTGAVIQGSIISETRVGDTHAIVPQIAGTAELTRALTIFA